MAHSRYILHPKTIPTLRDGKHSDGGGLYFYKLASGYSQWVFRFTWLGKRQEMGLGGYPATPLSKARELADAHRVVLQSGQNPKDVRDGAKRVAVDVAVKKDPKALERQRLRSIAPLAFEARKKELKGDGRAGRWYSPLQTHVLPAMGNKLVSEIDGNAVQKALKSIWHEKPDVARKAITRLDACLRYARAMGIPVDRNAIADARELLGKQVHVAIPIPAMAWQDVPAFYATLDGGSAVHLALRLLILTGVRSGPLRFAQMSQIKGSVWTIPGDNMKGNKGK
ncbi:MAG: integrase family protein, partial [Paracoccaceae bacterium]